MIICEKPTASSLGETRAMKEVIEKYKVFTSKNFSYEIMGASSNFKSVKLLHIVWVLTLSTMPSHFP